MTSDSPSHHHADLQAANPAPGEQGCLRDLVEALGGNPEEVRDPGIVIPIAWRRVPPGGTVLHEGAPATTVYVLRSGSLKQIRTSEDGYEQVLSFVQPGELIGYEALYCGHQPTGVVALEASTVVAVPMNDLHALRRGCAALDRAIQMALSRQLVRAAGITEMMAAVAADVRLARFLLWMSERRAELGQAASHLQLGMCRRDIASLLGVAHETVSRSFSQLADAGLVKVLNRDVHILDTDGLRMHARSTRRPSEDGVPHVQPPSAKVEADALSMAWFPRAAVASVHA